MGRSRSRERRRSRSRSRSRDRDRRKQRSRSRSQDRDRRRQRSRSRSKDRVSRKDDRRDRSRSKDRHRRRSRSAGRDRDKRRTRSSSRSAPQLDRNQRSSRPASEARVRDPSEPPLPGPPPLPTGSHAPPPSAVPPSTSTATPALSAEQAAVEEKRRRLEAFKAKLSSAQPAAAPAKPAQPPAAAAGVAEGLFGQDDDDDSSTKVVLPTAAELIAARRAREDAEEAAAAEQRRARAEARAAALAAEYGGAFYPGDPQAGAGGPGTGPAAPVVEEEEEVDPLDAFMAGEVLPEVRARQEAEAAAKEAERIRAAELLAQGKGPTRPSVLSDSEEEPEPDSRIQIPANKIKYMVGPGGVKIMEIQRKSKCRIQVLKEEDDLNRAWGSGIASAVQQQAQAAIKLRQQQQQAALQRKYKIQAKADKAAKVVLLGTGSGAEQQPQAAGFVPEGKAQEQPPPEEPSSSGDEEPAANAPPRKMATLLLYGDHKAIEACEKLIYEAIDNKAQKKAQREKEYAKKRDEKSRNRQLYILRHTRDYETLEVPVGTSRAEVKKAYRRLALLWHPDKHPNNVEEAQAKFQTIQKAYDSLMSTNEDERIEALTGR